MWPLFRPQDCVRVRATGCVGWVSYIEPNEVGDNWVFHVIFESRESAYHDVGELELVEPRGHDEEIELVFRTSAENAPAVAREVVRLAAETSGLETRSQSLETAASALGSTRATIHGRRLAP